MQSLIQDFESQFASPPRLYVRAPGRVNLIGEHTDYNDGFVFPVAIDRQVQIVAAPRSDARVVLHSLDFGETVTFTLDDIQKIEGAWANYPKGVAHVLQQEGYTLTGAEAVLTGNVPLGAGLSSSAAIEVAFALMYAVFADIKVDRRQFALLTQRAENQFVGVNCGIMDQFISLMGQVGHALFLDCRSLDYELVPLPMDVMRVVVCNTKVKRELTGSEYNERRAECERGVALLAADLPGIQALRDVSYTDFEKHRAELPPLTQRRCGYVIQENERVQASVEALQAEDYARFGQLMAESHEGLRDDYEVSCPELDLMVEIASDIDGVLGARMTGAGFGGCTVNLVREDAIDSLKEAVLAEYPAKTGIQPEIYVCQVADGASTTWLN